MLIFYAIIISIMHEANCSFRNFLVIFIIITISTSSSIISSLPNTNFNCTEQFLLYSQSIPSNINQKFIIIDSLIKNNQGDVVVKVFPIRENTISSQIPSMNDIINQMRQKQTLDYSNYTSKSSRFESYLDLQGLFTYSSSSIIKIQNDQISNKIKSIFIVFYRVNQTMLGSQNNLFSCTDNIIKYTIQTSNEAICPNCLTNNSLFPFFCSQQGYCVCKNNYIGKGCQLEITKLYLETNDQRQAYPYYAPYQFTAQPLSRQYYYFTSSSKIKVRIFYQQPLGKIKVLSSIQTLTDDLPQLTTANVYNNNKQLWNSFTLSQNQILLLSVTNMENQTVSYFLKIQEIPEFPSILRIILISLGVCLFALVVCLVSCYVFFTCYKMRMQRQKVCDEAEYPDDLFPEIRFYEFRIYILEFSIPSQYKYCLFNKSQSEMSNLSKNDPHNLIDDKDKQKICSICLQQITDESMIKYTFCNHIHDAKCLDQWMGRQKNCPLCRQSFDAISVYKWRQKIKDTIEIIIDEESQKTETKQQVSQQFNKTINYFNEAEKKDYILESIRKRSKREYNNNIDSLKEIIDNPKQKVIRKIPKNHISSQENDEDDRKKNSSQPVNKQKQNYKSLEICESFERKSLPLQDQGIDEKIYKYYKSIWLYNKKQKIDTSATLRQKDRTSTLGFAIHQDVLINGHSERLQENCLKMRKRQMKNIEENGQITGQSYNHYQIQRNINDIQQQN